MSDNSEQRFNVYFAGECLEGHDIVDVREAVGKLFKAQDDTLSRLFSGNRQPVKRGCDKGTALKYQRAMAKAGARAIVERAASSAAVDGVVADPQAAAEIKEDAGAKVSPATAAPSGSLTLAPDGTEVLRPEERAQVTPVDIPTDHLEALPIGDRLSPESPPVAPVPMPNFELANAGAELSDAKPPPAMNVPSTESLSLTPGDYDLSDCAPPPPAPEDIPMGHLVLAEAGEELLDADHRTTVSDEAPPTDHLRVEDPHGDP